MQLEAIIVRSIKKEPIGIDGYHHFLRLEQSLADDFGLGKELRKIYKKVRRKFPAWDGETITNHDPGVGGGAPA